MNDKKFGWNIIDSKNSSLYYKGSKEFAETILNIALKNPDNTQELTNQFKRIDNFSSGVIETDTHLIAWVDHIRSWPLFYTQINDEFFISQNAYEVKNKLPDPQYNETNLIEFKLSGYVTGTDTLIDGLYALNPGEFCIWNKKTKTLEKQKYFSYIPTFDSKISPPEAIKTQNKIFDDLTLRIINNAKGNTIWIPLSGGLDSRILLCKLHEHGYKNIETFTYGPRFNFESFIAKKIAKKLNVSWRFVTIPKKTLKQYFDSNNRKEFFKFAGNLKTIPCMREYSAIRYLHETGQIDQGAIFLNGQSGDYITGGHLSQASKNSTDYNKETLYKVLIDKHYDLWKKYKTPKNLDIVKEKINGLIKTITGKDIVIHSGLDGAKYEEIWEYEGRQICYVANGQRVYEYFGYDWEMPLWEKSLVDFYEPLSFDMKYGQKIYKEYLQSYNYKGLFPKKEPYIWRWPLPMLWVIPLAQIIGLFGGRKTKDKFYAKMRYWGHYANQYAFFDWQEHKETYKNARSIISLYVPKWLKDHNIGI